MGATGVYGKVLMSDNQTRHLELDHEELIMTRTIVIAAVAGWVGYSLLLSLVSSLL